MFKPTAKGYFSGAGGMELGLMQAGIQKVESLEDLLFGSRGKEASKRAV
jgi:hypothetical protein